MKAATDVGPLSDADYRSLARFRHALRAFTRFSEEAARAAGLTPAQHQLLLAVRGHPDGMPAPLADVAEMLQLRVHSVGELVDRAVGNGLVSRLADPDDHRRALVVLTPHGEHVLDGLARLHRDELRRFRREMNEVLRELDQA
jgi:DNA-binding MarR family transcriptional regulator